MKYYTWRHTVSQQDEYEVFANSKDAAREKAYALYDSGEVPSNTLVTEDFWDLVEVEDD